MVAKLNGVLESLGRKLEIIIYKHLFKSIGFRIGVDYFLEVHLFDLKNKVDTLDEIKVALPWQEAGPHHCHSQFLTNNLSFNIYPQI